MKIVFFTKGTLCRKVWVSLQLSCCIVSFLIASCSKEEANSLTVSEIDKSVMSPTKTEKTIVVRPGNSIQAAIEKAKAGSVIRIKPGVYKEAISIDKPNITLIGECHGKSGVIIENPGDKDNGITVCSNGDGFILKQVTVKGFRENGVFMIRVDNFLLSKVVAIDCGEYGLFPIFCKGGRIEYCSATGHTDTGIYIGQSEEIEMVYNVAFANVIGLEIENCSNIKVRKNKAFNNAAGILVVLLPDLTVKTSSKILISENVVDKNNHINFAEPGEGFEGFVPNGSGILVVGVDHTLVFKNVVKNNKFVGIAVVSTVLLGSIAGLPPESFDDIEPNPDKVKVQQNILKHNGFNPPTLPVPGADLLWDGSGNMNCWSGNTFNLSAPQLLPSCNSSLLVKN